MIRSKWKIYYCDGSVFSDEDGEPEDAPCLLVAVIVVQDGRKGRRFMHGTDWYRWQEDRWMECREFDILSEVATKGSVIARRGGYMREGDFEKILISAHEDPYIEVQSAPPAHPAWKA